MCRLGWRDGQEEQLAPGSESWANWLVHEQLLRRHGPLCLHCQAGYEPRYQEQVSLPYHTRLGADQSYYREGRHCEYRVYDSVLLFTILNTLKYVLVLLSSVLLFTILNTLKYVLVLLSSVLLFTILNTVIDESRCWDYSCKIRNKIIQYCSDGDIIGDVATICCTVQ